MSENWTMAMMLVSGVIVVVALIRATPVLPEKYRNASTLAYGRNRGAHGAAIGIWVFVIVLTIAMIFLIPSTGG